MLNGLRKNQGFYTYRNKRLLVWGNWFRQMRQGDLSKLARVQVDIPNSLDDLWTLDIKKSTASPADSMELDPFPKKQSKLSNAAWHMPTHSGGDASNHRGRRIPAGKLHRRTTYV